MYFTASEDARVLCMEVEDHFLLMERVTTVAENKEASDAWEGNMSLEGIQGSNLWR